MKKVQQEQPLNRHDILEKEKNRASHLQPWQFKKGQSGNPKGRVPGKSLKERAKAMLNAMTEEEEQAFLEGIDKRIIWEMAEGKASQGIGQAEDLDKLTINIVEYADNNDSSQLQKPD